MNNRLVIIGVVILAALYVFFSSIYVVNEREQAIVMRFGQITDVRTEPGIYFKIPTDFVDSVQIIEDRLLRQDISDLRVQVSGGAFYEVDAFLTYRITDARLFRERAQGQLAGVVRMLDEGRDCEDVVMQLSAVSRALDRAGFAIIASGMRQCLVQPEQDGATAALDVQKLEKLFLSLA